MSVFRCYPWHVTSGQGFLDRLLPVHMSQRRSTGYHKANSVGAREVNHYPSRCNGCRDSTEDSERATSRAASGVTGVKHTSSRMHGGLRSRIHSQRSSARGGYDPRLDPHRHVASMLLLSPERQFPSSNSTPRRKKYYATPTGARDSASGSRESRLVSSVGMASQ